MSYTPTGKLAWDAIGERFFEGGIEQVALFPFKNKMYMPGVAWSGVTSINEGTDGGDENELFADDIKYAGIRGTEKFNPTIEAYTYPDEFAECDGSKAPTSGVYVGQQRRQPFGLAYKSKIGNDEDGFDHGYKLHLVYYCTASPAERSRETINDDPDAMTFSWDCSTTPENVNYTDSAGYKYKPTAHIEIDSRKFATGDAAAKLAALEAFVFGTDGNPDATPAVAATDALMPTAESVVKYMAGESGAALTSSYVQPSGT